MEGWALWGLNVTKILINCTKKKIARRAFLIASVQILFARTNFMHKMMIIAHYFYDHQFKKKQIKSITANIKTIYKHTNDQ